MTHFCESLVFGESCYLGGFGMNELDSITYLNQDFCSFFLSLLSFGLVLFKWVMSLFDFF